MSFLLTHTFFNKYSLGGAGIPLFTFLADMPLLIKLASGILGMGILFFQFLKSREQWLLERDKRKKSLKKTTQL